MKILSGCFIALSLIGFPSLSVSANESCKAVIIRPTHATTGTRGYIVPDGKIEYFDGANNKTVVCARGGGCVPRSAVKWLTPCPYDGHWPFGAGE